MEAGASQAGAPGTGSAEGTVTASGTPLAGVPVSVCELEEPVTCYGATTNGSGHYSVAGLPEGEFTARATPPAHDGYAATTSEEFEVIEGAATTEDIALRQDGSLSGLVSGEGGAPVANVGVEVCGGEEFLCFTTETEAAGHYSFPELAEGSYSEIITPAAHSGYAVTERGKISVNGAQNTTEDVALTEVGAISGIVTGTGHVGVANVTVTACGSAGCQSVKTNGAGEYSVAEAADDSYTMLADPPAHDGYANTTGPNTVVTGRADAIDDIALTEVGEVNGTVTAVNHTAVVGAYAELCNVNYACYTAVTNSAGEYSIEEVAEGTYVVEVFPPPGYDEGSSPQFAVAAHGHVTENVVVNSPIPPPNGTVVSGISEIEVAGVKLPEIQWSENSPITTKACVGGSVTATVTADHLGTQTLETTGPVTLTETPSSSGTYDGSIPPVVPKHGEGKIILKVTGCPNSGEDGETEFTIYIDPSGIVVDANNGDAPVAGANVILKSAEAEAGPYTAVPNGSAVMSPANRTNPGTTNAKGEFGWDTIAGFYEVEASKEGCGTVTTPVFFVPPPQTNLELKLHCLLEVETSSLPKAKVGSAYDATLTASGGFTAYKWKKTAKLPKGLKLGKTGVITGTPSKKVVPGFYTVGVEVKDAKKHTATASLTLHIS